MGSAGGGGAAAGGVSPDAFFVARNVGVRAQTLCPRPAFGAFGGARFAFAPSSLLSPSLLGAPSGPFGSTRRLRLEGHFFFFFFFSPASVQRPRGEAAKLKERIEQRTVRGAGLASWLRRGGDNN